MRIEDVSSLERDFHEARKARLTRMSGKIEPLVPVVIVTPEPVPASPVIEIVENPPTTMPATTIVMPPSANRQINRIMRATSKRFGLTLEEMISPSRKKRFSYPRQLAIAIAKRTTSASLPKIGRHFGRDHTTVLHACRQIDGWLTYRENVQADYDAIIQAIGGQP